MVILMVSLREGQTTLANSARASLINCMGFAIELIWFPDLVRDFVFWFKPKNSFLKGLSRPYVDIVV